MMINSHSHSQNHLTPQRNRPAFMRLQLKQQCCSLLEPFIQHWLSSEMQFANSLTGRVFPSPRKAASSCAPEGQSQKAPKPREPSVIHPHLARKGSDPALGWT